MVPPKENTLLGLDKIAWHFVQRWKMSSLWGSQSSLNLLLLYVLQFILNSQFWKWKKQLLVGSDFGPIAVYVTVVKSLGRALRSSVPSICNLLALKEAKSKGKKGIKLWRFSSTTILNMLRNGWKRKRNLKYVILQIFAQG